jgi:signal transduction histidine kinase
VKSELSLRWRVLLGAALWTTGLFTVAGVLVTSMLFRHPSTPRIFHSLLIHSVPAAIVACACLAAGLWQVRRGLSPFRQLREQLSSVRAGRDRQVSGTYPAEVQPLVDDLNALLDHRDRTVRRALAKAADLAHGLKTPLAVLTQEAALIDAAGHHELAATVGEHVERMRRQLEVHLAHARAAASGATPGARCNVAESAAALARTLERLYTERGIAVRVEIDPEYAVRVQREDLDEMLGNLLDNACKWALSQVMVSSVREGGHITVTVDDDGPGIPPSMREAVLQRGMRADEASPGSGLGLAIVQELAELYGGAIFLDSSRDSGLQARLRLPAIL